MDPIPTFMFQVLGLGQKTILIDIFQFLYVWGIKRRSLFPCMVKEYGLMLGMGNVLYSIFKIYVFIIFISSIQLR